MVFFILMHIFNVECFAYYRAHLDHKHLEEMQACEASQDLRDCLAQRGTKVSTAQRDRGDQKVTA